MRLRSDTDQIGFDVLGRPEFREVVCARRNLDTQIFFHGY